MTRKIVYTEPASYFPKDVLEKAFGKAAADAAMQCESAGAVPEEKKLFEYRLSGARDGEYSRVIVLDSPGNTVLFGKIEDYPLCDHILYVDDNELHSLKLSDAAMSAVKAALQDSRLYTLGELECIPIEDGWENKVSIRNGSVVKVIEGYNLSYAIRHPKAFPNAAVLARFIRKMSTILGPEGVDKACLYLGHR